MEDSLITKTSLESDLRKLGIKEGDMIFVRISYKSIGKVEGGPKTVIDAILNVIGEKGTLLATAFPKRIRSYKRFFNRHYVYYKGMKPITGAIPSVMCSYPNAFFSGNPISTYVAIGKDAEYLTESHTVESESYDIVRLMIERYQPKCLRIGGNVLDGTAHLPFSDGLKQHHAYQRRLPEGIYYSDNGKRTWKERTVSAFCYDGFRNFFMKNIINNPKAVLSEGKVGNGQAMVTSMRETYEIEKKFITPDPTILICDSPKCLICRLSFSFSDTSQFKYFLKSIPRLFKKGWKHELGAYRTIFLATVFGKKCV